MGRLRMSESTSTSGRQSDDAERIAGGYAFQGPALEFGSVVLDGSVYPDAHIRVPLSTLNRHAQ
jgi:hypothetical protein